MRRLIAVLLYLVMGTAALAQTGAVDTKAQLTTDINTNWADNSIGAITPAITRQTLLNAVVSFQQAPRVNAQTGTSYTIVVDDYGKLVTFSNAATVTVTVPQATTNFATFNFFACNKGVGRVDLTPTTSTINGVATYALATNQCSLVVSDGANWQAMTFPIGRNAGGFQGPTVQNLTTGTNATYTTPAGVTYIELTIIGGGGGGGAQNTNAGTAGNPTCWNTSGTACSTPVYQAGGGGGGATASAAGGAGGTVSGSGTCQWSVAGQNGMVGASNGGGNAVNAGGGLGGNSSRAGAGVGVQNAAGTNAAANSGSGGGGGSLNAVGPINSGSGGGAGATCYAIINSPAATYTYTIGAAANGGAAGTSAGGNGAAGIITVIEHYGQ